jgi:hypothetical protein
LEIDAEPLTNQVNCMKETYTFTDALKASLRLLDYGKKICRDGVEFRPIDRTFVLIQLGFVVKYLYSKYNLTKALQLVDEKLKKRYANGYSPEASVNRTV